MDFKHRVLLSFIVILFGTGFLKIQAQSFKLTGNIVDSLENGLELATVLLLQEADSVMAGFSITNPKGKFQIDGVKAGDYILNVTFLGYKDINKKIAIQATIDLGTILMKASSQTISDIIVSATHIPIRIKNDTVEYNAAAFKTRPSDNVEELLKKLPGIEVADDGTIKAHGEEVKNVFVDGKEFFGSDPTIATKNLPSDIIDNVQVFDKKSDMAEFSGVDDGEREKTINLVLKEGKKAGYFGRGTLGYGTGDRFDGKFNINRFTKKTQLSGIGMLNNVNKQGFSFREYIDFMGGIGNLMSGGGGRSNASDSGVPISNGLGNGFVNTGAGGLNYNVDFSKNLEINSSYFYNRIKNDIRQEVTRQNILSIGGFDTDQNAELVNVNKNHKFNSKIVATIDSTQKIITRIEAGWNDGNSNSMSDTRNSDENGNLVSSGQYDNSSMGNQVSVGLNSNYMKRLKKTGRFFNASINIGLSDNDQNADLNSINSIVRGNGGIPDSLVQEQIQRNLSKDYTIRLSYTEPLGGRKYLEVNASRRNNKNDFDKDFYDIQFLNNIPVSSINTQLSNSYTRDYSFNRLSLNFKLNRNNSSLTTGLSLQHSDLNGILQDEGVRITQDYYFLLPSLVYNKDISASRSLTIRYNTNVNEPSLEQLQPQLDNSDPLNIYVGNPDLEPSYRHNLRINYNSFSQFSNIGLFSFINTSYTRNDITNSRTINEFFIQTTQPVNTDYSFNSSLYINFNAPLKFIKQRINLSNNLSFSDNFLFINGTENLANRISNSIRLSLDNWKKDVVDLEVGTRLGFNKTGYSENSELNQSYMDSEYYTNLNIDLKGDWDIGTNLRHTIYSGEKFGEQTSITRWEASISKIMLKSKKLRMEISVFDILDQNQNINRSSNLNYIQDERIESLGRYFMLSLSYSFSGFGETGMFGGGRGGGRGRGRG